MSKKIFFVFLILISFVYLFLRFYHLDTLLDFRFDQGFFLLDSKSTIESPTIRLLGPPTSKIFEGRQFFVGSNYYYLLGIVGQISQWDPLLITSFFIIFEFIFYLIFIFFLRQRFNPFCAFLVFFTIAISPYLVGHSRFFWNPHMLIPLSVITLISFDKFVQNKKYIYLLIASLCWGFAFACHYSAIFWAIFFIYFLIKSRLFLNLKSYIIILFGVFVGNLPFFIFEIRHNFYNLKTFIYVYTHSSQGGELTSHYFVFPLLIFTIFLLLFFLKKLPKSNIYLFLILSLITTIQFKIYPSYPSLGKIDGWSYSDQEKVANIISKNCPNNFNVAATMQGDTRAYDLRLLLTTKNCLPNQVENYPNSKKIFLIAKNDHTPETETVWEIDSYKPFKITQKIPLNDKLNFYELTK